MLSVPICTDNISNKISFGVLIFLVLEIQKPKLDRGFRHYRAMIKCHGTTLNK